MKTASPQLIELLNSSTQITSADIYTITLQGGAILRYTSHERFISFGGNVYEKGPLISRGRTKTSIGVSVDTLDMTISADDEIQINAKPLIQFIASGGLDGARLRLERVFAANWQTPATGSLIMFAGRISDVTISRYEAKITVRSDLELLDVKIPRNVYQAGCMNTLYDAACGKDRDLLTVRGAAVVGYPAPTKSAFVTNLQTTNAFFDLGAITFTTGANAGISRTVKSYWYNYLLQVIAPFPFAPAAGDLFDIYPGCDKTLAACTGKFYNTARFRGQPFIPGPETVI